MVSIRCRRSNSVKRQRLFSAEVFLSSSLRASHLMFHYFSLKVFLSFSLRALHLMFHYLSSKILLFFSLRALYSTIYNFRIETRHESQHPKRNCQYTRWYAGGGHDKHQKSVYSVHGQWGTLPTWCDFKNCIKQNFICVSTITKKPK